MNKCRLHRASLALLAFWTVATPEAASAEPEPPAYASKLRRKVVLDGLGEQRFRIEDRMQHYGVPGVSVAVVKNCEVVDARGFGQADPLGRAVGQNTLFQAGSVSKVVATVGALKLVEDGTLSLDADVTRYLRTWSLPRPAPYENAKVTLRHLLSHSAGLSVAGFKGYPAGSALPTLVQILGGVAPANTSPVRLEAVPGSAWKYSGGGFVLTQRVMEQATGTAFKDLIRHRVFRPAGMLRSTYDAPLGHPAADAAAGTLADGTPIPGGWKLYPEHAAAGRWATPTDLARLAIELVQSLRGTATSLLNEETAREMMRPQSGNWGLGVELAREGRPRMFSHTGAPIGYRTLWLMHPDTCDGATIMTNADEGMQLAYEIARALADHYNWPDRMESEHAPYSATTDAIAQGFAGTYELREFPGERFHIERQREGSLTWGRVGRGRVALEASGLHQLLSPDSGMRAVALERHPDSRKVTTVELRVGTRVNVADRVKQP